MRTCPKSGKKSFSTQLDAEIAISRVVSRNKRRRKQSFRDDPQRAFYCGSCRSWHMTSWSKGD